MNKKNIFFSISLILSGLLFFSGCIKQQKDLLSNLSLEHKMLLVSVGMEKLEVIKIIGVPSAVRASISDNSGKIIEILEYRPYLLKTYWFHFYDGKLLKWGMPGDWKKEADSISEIRYR